jgi:RimJ/RimL family protein N-acetyltransferase
MPTTCTVRKLGLDDAVVVTALRREALEAHPLAFSASLPDDPTRLTDFLRSALAPSDDAAMFGAFVEDALVGMVGIVRNPGQKERHKALIWGMYVRSAYRRTGGGESLLRAAIHQAQSWPGVQQVHLSVTEVAAEAKRLYERNGFQEWGREPRALCWQGRYVEDSHMVLRLVSRPFTQD